MKNIASLILLPLAFAHPVPGHIAADPPTSVAVADTSSKRSLTIRTTQATENISKRELNELEERGRTLRRLTERDPTVNRRAPAPSKRSESPFRDVRVRSASAASKRTDVLSHRRRSASAASVRTDVIPRRRRSAAPSMPRTDVIPHRRRSASASSKKSLVLFNRRRSASAESQKSRASMLPERRDSTLGMATGSTTWDDFRSSGQTISKRQYSTEGSAWDNFVGEGAAEEGSSAEWVNFWRVNFWLRSLVP